MTMSRITLTAFVLVAGCAAPEVPEASVEVVTLTAAVDELEVEQSSAEPITVIATDRTDVAVTATVLGVAVLQQEQRDGRLVLGHTCEYPPEDVRHESVCRVRFEAEIPRSLQGLFVTAGSGPIDLDVGDVGDLLVSSVNSDVSVAAETVGALTVTEDGPGSLLLQVAHADTANIAGSNTDMDITLVESGVVDLRRGAGEGRVVLVTPPEVVSVDLGGDSGSMEIDLPAGPYAIHAHPDADLRLEGVTNEPDAASSISLTSAGSLALVGQ